MRIVAGVVVSGFPFWDALRAGYFGYSSLCFNVSCVCVCGALRLHSAL